jgi:transposase
MDRNRALAQHRAAVEAALAQIKHDLSLTDMEKGQQVTRVLAEANARTVALSRAPGCGPLAERGRLA